jgi:hypothetical protein
LPTCRARRVRSKPASQDEAFTNTFAFSTTVNSPDFWIPLYARSAWAALPFLAFVLGVIYISHNIVIAYIYQASGRCAERVAASLKRPWT